MHVEISGVPGTWVPGDDTQPGKTEGEFYVQTLKVKNRNSTGYPDTTTTERPIQDAYYRGKTRTAHSYG